MSSNQEEKPTKMPDRRKKNWSNQEVRSLLSVWAEHYADLTRTKRNKPIFEKMAEQLKELGYLRSFAEVRVKIKNLTAEYRSEKTLHGCTVTGTSPSEWPHFYEVHRIIGSSHHHANPHMSESFTCESQELELEQTSVASDIEELVSLTEREEEDSMRIIESGITHAEANHSRVSTTDKDSEDEEIRREIKKRKTSTKKTNVMEKLLKQMEQTDGKILMIMEQNNKLIEKIVEKL